jgi:predicted transcriptional regulator
MELKNMNKSKPMETELLDLTTRIVTAQVSNNTVPSDALRDLIPAVFGALAKLGQVSAEPTKLIPAVPVKHSVFPDHIVCLEDGKKLKMLKRHLAAAYDMTPDQYRTRWGLPSDYPMVAPDYASRRSELAKTYGLGRNQSKLVEVETVAPAKPSRKKSKPA